MNRRNFIKLLGTIPFIPLVVKPSEENLVTGEVAEQEKTTVYFTPYLDNKVVSWNGEQWSNLAIDSDGNVGGHFVNVSDEYIFCCNPNNPNDLYKWDGAGNSWRSSDGGESWEQVSRGFEGLNESITTGNR